MLAPLSLRINQHFIAFPELLSAPNIDVFSNVTYSYDQLSIEYRTETP